MEELDDLLDENDRLKAMIWDENRETTLRNKLRRDNGELLQQLQEKEQQLIEVNRNLEGLEEELIITRSKLRCMPALLLQT